MKFSELLNESKNWNLKFENYRIIVNDNNDHNLINRLNLRTNETLESMNNKIQKAINKVMESVKFGKINLNLDFSVRFLISKFKIIINVNEDNKIIKIKTILKFNQYDSGVNFIHLNEKFNFLNLNL